MAAVAANAAKEKNQKSLYRSDLYDIINRKKFDKEGD